MNSGPRKDFFGLLVKEPGHDEIYLVEVTPAVYFIAGVSDPYGAMKLVAPSTEPLGQLEKRTCLPTCYGLPLARGKSFSHI